MTKTITVKRNGLKIGLNNGNTLITYDYNMVGYNDTKGKEYPLDKIESDMILSMLLKELDIPKGETYSLRNAKVEMKDTRTQDQLTMTINYLGLTK